MENENSQERRLNGLSPEDDIVPEVQERSFGIVGSDKDDEYGLQTPEQKPCLQENYLSSGSLSSDLSTKEESDPMSSSSSSSDAESGAYKLPIKSYLLQQVDGDEGLTPKNQDEEADTFHIHYGELLEKVSNNESELKLTKKKLEFSQEEIARLKYENLTLVEELGRTIEKVRTSEDNVEKMEHKLRNEFEQDKHHLQNQLKLANQSIDVLKAELGSERKLVSELQQIINTTNNDLTDYGHKIEELKLLFNVAHQDFSKEKSQIQLDINHLVEEKVAIETRLTKAELENKSLVDQIQQCESKETGLLAEIKQLNSELSHKSEFIESLNKILDASKLNYDTLMTEKDQVLAQVQTLTAEVKNRDTSIKQLEEQVSHLVSAIEKAEDKLRELRTKVMDQEKELKQQASVISDRDEEKREAIRQLCFSLEYYRNGYHELRLAFPKNNHRSTVLAS